MPNAKDYKPSDHGIFGCVCGPSGTGKSYLLRSMREVGPMVVAITDSGELDGLGGHDIEYDLFDDTVNDLPKFLKWIDKQTARKDIRCIAVDHLSGGTTSPGISEMVMQDGLKVHGTTNPLELAHGQAYLGHANGLREVLQKLRLAAYSGKHVMCSVLAQLREDETDPKPGKVDEFKEKLMPAVHGTVRQHMAASFSLWLHSYTQGQGQGAQWFVTSLPDAVRPAKKRLEFKEKWPDGKPINATRLPNEWKRLLEAVK